MNVTKNKTLILLASTIAIFAIASAGCCSGGLKRPNLAVLKFWENSDAVATKTPPPPARYFDPAPIQEEQVAQKAAEETLELNGQGLKNTLDQAIAKNALPIGQGNNDFNLPGKIKAIQKEQVKTPIETLQKELQTAMQTPAKNSGSSTKAVDLPLNLKSPGSKTQLNQSLAGLNKSIYDANGKLVNSTSEVKESILAKLDPARKKALAGKALSGEKMNEFIAQAKNKVAKAATSNSNDFDFKAPTGFKAPTDFKAPTLPKSAPLANTFAAAKTKTITKNIPVAASSGSSAELKLVQAQVAEANRQIEQLKQQLAASSNKPQSPPVATTAPRAKPQPLAPSNWPAATPQRDPAEVIAQLKTPRFGTSNYSATSNSKPDNSFVSASPTNILRASKQFQPSQPTQPTGSAAQTGFPSTPHGNFSPEGKFGSTLSPIPSPQPARQLPKALAPQPAKAVDFQTTADNSMTLKAATPYTRVQPAAGVQQIKSDFSSGDIPASILNSSGSYAPGSVRQIGQ